MRIYGLKACDTCKKARKAFADADFVDVRDAPLTEEFLTERLAEFGQTLLNTRSTTWRGLSEEERASDPLALLQAHPALMKRPLIEKNGSFHLGWTQTVQDTLGVLRH